MTRCIGPGCTRAVPDDRLATCSDACLDDYCSDHEARKARGAAGVIEPSETWSPYQHQGPR